MGIKSILKKAEKHDVELVRIFFVDVQGRLKGLNIAVAELERALEEGVQFDGSSIEGFVRIEESDLIALPDQDTFRLFPFETGGMKTAMVMADVYKPDGTPFANDPRRVLRNALKSAEEAGFDQFFVGPELEFFYFSDNKTPIPVDEGGYFDTLPVDVDATAREEALFTLTKMGIKMEASHHEVAPSQHELDFRYSDALKMADQIMIAKLVIKEIARRHGLYATFMPKPISGVNGSGMHVHQSLFTDGKNAFYSSEDDYNLSEIGKHYLAGLLKHSKELTLITNPCVNSYKRLVPGYEAPTYITWGRRNRSALVRVPAFKPGHDKACRIEYRSPDPAANPYLAFAAMLNAGLKGIKEEYSLCPPKEENLFHLSEDERKERGIDSLPGTLHSATKAANQSVFLKDTLGEDLHRKYIANKRVEWNQYRIQVTDFEIRTYLPLL